MRFPNFFQIDFENIKVPFLLLVEVKLIRNLFGKCELESCSIKSRSEGLTAYIFRTYQSITSAPRSGPQPSSLPSSASLSSLSSTCSSSSTFLSCWSEGHRGSASLLAVPPRLILALRRRELASRSAGRGVKVGVQRAPSSCQVKENFLSMAAFACLCKIAVNKAFQS